MPNWVRTRISFNGKNERVNEIREFVKSVKDHQVNEFDFDKIVPMPKDLDVPASSSGSWGMKYLMLKAKNPVTWSNDEKNFMDNAKASEKKNPKTFSESIDLGKKYLKNIANYGYTSWYEWCCDNWGTKWNACETAWIADNIVEFETAWSFCEPVIKKLSELYSDVEISFSYADEDAGSNTGDGLYIAGNGVDCEYPDTASNRAYEIFLDLHPEYEGELVLDPDTNKYHWVEDDDE